MTRILKSGDLVIGTSGDRKKAEPITEARRNKDRMVPRDRRNRNPV